MYFGFGALLNGPHDQIAHRCRFAACRGVLTSHALPRLSWGPSLRAIASLLQAKYMPPRLGLCELSGRATRRAVQRGDGRAKAERLTACVKNLFFPDTHFLRKERRSSAARSALSSGCIKREKIDSAGGHRAALPGHPRPCNPDVRHIFILLRCPGI